MKIKFLTLALLLFFNSLASAQTKKVAVYVMGEDAGINKVLESKLVSTIAQSKDYTAVERTAAFLAELNKEQKYQRTGNVDDSELSRLGKQFGVQYICVAAVTEAFNERYLSARLIDVESAQVEGTASSSGTLQSLPGVVRVADSVALELLSNLDKSINTSDVKKVAVYVVKSDAAKDIGRVLGDKLVAGFTKSGNYVAIERTNSFLTQLNKEQKYQRTGVVDDIDISRLGKQFGVQYVCVAEVADVFSEKYISTRLIDVETAEVVNAYEVGGTITNMKECVQLADDIAFRLSRRTAKVFDVAEEMPFFPGGEKALLKYLMNNIKYPEIAEKKKKQGRVVCSFVVERDGSISNVKVIRSVYPALDKEAVRVIKSMPNWIPGSQNGSPVRVKYTVPVTFRLQ